MDILNPMMSRQSRGTLLGSSYLSGSRQSRPLSYSCDSFCLYHVFTQVNIPGGPNGIVVSIRARHARGLGSIPV